jgi:hypothetical protein
MVKPVTTAIPAGFRINQGQGLDYHYVCLLMVSQKEFFLNEFKDSLITFIASRDHGTIYVIFT